jgi:glycosyltransferase involved in cell wall biosynthesis
MMVVARDLGLAPRFLGAFRESDLPRTDDWEGWEVERIGPYFPLLNGRRPLLYLASVLRYDAALLRRLVELRPAMVHVSDFELFLPARIYTALAGSPLIYNIHDNLSQRYRCPRAVARLLNVLEGLAARAATVTVVPEEFRRAALPSWARAGVQVVRNSPIDPGYSPPAPLGERPTTLFFAGWLDEGRGIRQLLDLASSGAGLRLRVAGQGDDALLARIAATDTVEFLGYLRHAEVMSQTARCDFVTALYDPRRPINRYAASNKIAEALAVGRPPIINRELKIAALLEPYDCAVVVDYDDIASLGERLARLRSDEGRYRGMCQRARRAYEEHYSWEVVRAASRSAFQTAGLCAAGAT